MKRTIFTLVMGLLVLSSLCVNAQDVIVKKDNTTILSRVTKVSETEIEYKKWSNLDGPTYTIGVSEILSITYENGEVENITTIKKAKVKDYMERDGKRLTLNGRLLSDEEVRALVGEANYATYSGAKRQITAGRVFTVLFIGTTAAALYMAVDGVARNNGSEVVSAYGMAAVADISLALMIVNSVAGKSRMNWVAREYNNSQSGYSLNIAPSIINVRTPQSQNNYALGMTLRYSF